MNITYDATTFVCRDDAILMHDTMRGAAARRASTRAVTPRHDAARSRRSRIQYAMNSLTHAAPQPHRRCATVRTHTAYNIFASRLLSRRTLFCVLR